MDNVQEANALAQKILDAHNESATSSHLQWLTRECAKLIHEQAELAKRREALDKREKQIEKARLALNGEAKRRDIGVQID